MELLSIDDPVFVVDLTPAAVAACRRDFLEEAEGHATPLAERELPDPPARPVRAIALVVALDQDPALVPVSATRDMVALDATARLLRSALATGRRVAELALLHGDEVLRQLYLGRKLPAFVFDGFPAALRDRLPAGLWDLVP